MWIVLLDTSEAPDPYGPFRDLNAAAEFLRMAENRNRAGTIARFFAPTEFVPESEEDGQP
jgi:hypothetical protein